MKSKFYFLIALLQCIAFVAKSQQILQISGTVLNAKDSTPIVYAHVGIPTQGIGVITNDVGAFSLNYSNLHQSDTLKISYLGYKTYSIGLYNLSTSLPLIIYLKNDILELDVTTISPRSDSGRFILREALKRLKQNYPTKMYQMNAFYREKIQNRDDYRFTRLIEGMLDIRDMGIRSDPSHLRIRLNEFRKSNNMAKQTLGQIAWRKFFGEQNNLYAILSQDPVRIHYHNERTNHHSGNESWFSNSRRYWLGEILVSSQSSIYIANMTSYNGEEVYHLKFKCSAFYGSIYVNCHDFGLHHVEFYHGFDRSFINESELSSEAKSKLNEFEELTKSMQFEGKYFGKLTIDYQKVDEKKYYLSYIEWLNIGDFRKSNIREGESTGSYNSCILMVNSIQTNRKEIEKIKLRETVNKFENTNNLKMKYNEGFWKNYNVLLATPLENKAVKDLTFEESFEQQFKKNQ